MMYLLDTHTLIWTLMDSVKLSGKVKKIIQDRRNKIFVSTVSYWEISLKTALEKFEFTGLRIDEIPAMISELGISELVLGAPETISYKDLKKVGDHKDPFDRMLIWQAICHNMTLVSKDRFFTEYQKQGLKLVW